mgnify:FL=1
MDGLECKVILLSEVRHNKDSRIDSAFYTMQLSRNRILRYEPIEKYLSYAQYGVSKDMNTESKGYPIFRMNELHGGLCDLTTDKYVELTNEDFNKTCLHDGDVLFNRTNSYDKVGRTGIYYSHNAPQTFASYLVRFIPDNINLLSEYLTAFLNSKYGIQEIRRRARQSINQTNVNPEEVKRILIPILDKKLQFYIKSLYKSADALRVEATNKYKDAETELANWLNIRIEAQTVPVVSEKTISYSYNVTGRLDAEYYQPKYDLIVSSLNTKETLESICNLYDENYLPDEEKYYRYIELANVGSFGEITDTGSIVGEELPTRARRIVKSGQVIVSSIEGSLQSCALITDEFDGAICSTGFYVVDSDKLSSETLLVLFKSEAIQELLKQRCSGTILTSINKDEFLSLPLPKIDEDIQAKISEQIKESFALRRKSKQLLEDAKRAVEIAIEQDEESAIEWLKDRVDL